MALNNGDILGIIGAPLIKIQSSDIIDDIQKNGTIYMNKLNYYRTLESESNDDIIGDNTEGKIPIHSAQFFKIDTGESIELSDTYINTADSDCFVFCMFFINPQNGTFDFSEKQKEELLAFGDSALIIKNQYEFIKRIEYSAKQKNYTLSHKSVSYYNETVDSGDLWLSLLKGMHNIAFWKRKKYSYQQEYRFIIKDDTTKDNHLILRIGNISDISEKIDTKTLLSSQFRYKSNF